MTFQEAHKNGKNGLVNRRDLTKEKLSDRLSYYFNQEEITEIFAATDTLQCWTDGYISIVCTDMDNHNQYIAIATGNFMKLIEP